MVSSPFPRSTLRLILNQRLTYSRVIVTFCNSLHVFIIFRHLYVCIMVTHLVIRLFLGQTLQQHLTLASPFACSNIIYTGAYLLLICVYAHSNIIIIILYLSALFINYRSIFKYKNCAQISSLPFQPQTLLVLIVYFFEISLLRDLEISGKIFPSRSPRPPAPLTRPNPTRSNAS